MKEHFPRERITDKIGHDLAAFVIYVATWHTVTQQPDRRDTPREAGSNEDNFIHFQAWLRDEIDYLDSTNKMLVLTPTLPLGCWRRIGQQAVKDRLAPDVPIELTKHDMHYSFDGQDRPLNDHHYRDYQLYVGNGEYEISYTVLAAAIKQNARLGIHDATSNEELQAYCWQDLIA